MKLSILKLNKHNPRTISDEAFQRLCDSIKRDPQFMDLRPIVIDEANVILGGNQRYKACQRLGMTEVPDAWVRVATGLTAAQRKRFIVVDNTPEGMGGEWDIDILAADWDRPELGELGFEKLMAELTENIQPFGDTETDRDGQGVASTWESCRKTGAAPVRIGPWESRLPIKLAEAVVADCTRRFEKTGKSMHERLAEILTCGLRY